VYSYKLINSLKEAHNEITDLHNELESLTAKYLESNSTLTSIIHKLDLVHNIEEERGLVVNETKRELDNVREHLEESIMDATRRLREDMKREADKAKQEVKDEVREVKHEQEKSGQELALFQKKVFSLQLIIDELMSIVDKLDNGGFLFDFLTNMLSFNWWTSKFERNVTVEKNYRNIKGAI